MNSMEAMLQKGGLKVISDPNLTACALPITQHGDSGGVILTIDHIPDSYFEGGSEVTGFIGAGLHPDLFDRKVDITDNHGVLILKKGAPSTEVHCVANVFSSIVEQLNIGAKPFYIRYTFGPSTGSDGWHFSQPLIAWFAKK